MTTLRWVRSYSEALFGGTLSLFVPVACLCLIYNIFHGVIVYGGKCIEGWTEGKWWVAFERRITRPCFRILFQTRSFLKMMHIHFYVSVFLYSTVWHTITYFIFIRAWVINLQRKICGIATKPPLYTVSKDHRE